MKEVVIENEGKKYVVFLRKIKWKEYREAIDSGIESQLVGGQVVGRAKTMKIVDAMLKKSIDKIVEKDSGMEVKNIAEFIDNLSPSVVGKLLKGNEEVNAFFPEIS